METKTPAVETQVETAATQQEAVVTPQTTEVDYEAILAQKDAELAKVQEDRNNYRKGLLQAKGKIPTDDYSDDNQAETQEAMVRRIAREELLSTKEAQLQAEKDIALKNVLKRNRELEVALKNRGQISGSSGQGSNQDKPEGKKDNYLSNEQLNALKAKGWDDKKIESFKINARKVFEMPK